MQGNKKTRYTYEEYKNNYTPKKRKLGDRFNGYRVRTLPPMMYISPIIMRQRSDSQNYFEGEIEVSKINEYIRNKATRENMPKFSFSHVIVAAYLRVLCDHPALNRFISGQRIYHRNEILLSMMVKKEISLNAQESAIKPAFEITDTSYDVYKKMQAEIEKAITAGDSNHFDNVARTVVQMPTLILKAFIDILKLIDYFGIFPKVLYKASPFHATLFITNLGSLGIPPIYHHLYNFGDLPVFIAFGKIQRKNEINDNGETVTKKYIGYKVVCDERIADGHYYADAFKQFSKILAHPEELDNPPKEILIDVD